MSTQKMSGHPGPQADLSKGEPDHDLCDAQPPGTEAENSQREAGTSHSAPLHSAMSQTASWVAQAALFVIRFYQRCVSPFTPPSCRFHPSCSHYAYKSIQRFGLWRGGWLGLKRICKCHPFHPGGYDPVPELETNSQPVNARQTSTREMNSRSEPLENRHLI
jgi:putative membrane protein insertion efficiency factor